MSRQRHNIGPLSDEEAVFLTLEYRKARSVISISLDMVRPEKFIYRQLELLGLVYPKGSGIIICIDCQIEVKAKNRKTRRCPDCADSRWKLKIKEHRVHYFENNPVALNKMRARTMANWWLVSGRLTRPSHCEICNQTPQPLKNGQSGLRMDHYKGYDKQYWTTVRFVCIPCDSIQIKTRNKDEKTTKSI